MADSFPFLLEAELLELAERSCPFLFQSPAPRRSVRTLVQDVVERFPHRSPHKVLWERLKHLAEVHGFVRKEGRWVLKPASRSAA